MTFQLAKLPTWLRAPLMCTALLITAGCVTFEGDKKPGSGLNPVFVSKAIHAATELRTSGRRVWCVPFARNASGIELRGNAETWWGKAKGVYARGNQPIVGSVMAFSGTRKLPMGHVAVVSEIVSDREIRIHHANWHRNKISLDMGVKDVSKNNDWSRVRVETNPGSYGSVYLIDGFIWDEARSG